MSFTLRDYATAIAPKITATLSIMGSVFIITDILKSKEKMGRTYSRILLVMSVYDFLTSIAQGLSTWPIPQAPEPSSRPFASGTTFTCSFQGFFTQLGVGAPMYNCSLSFYYLIVIAFAFSEDRVKQIEWFMHGIPLIFSLGTAIAGLPLTLYNNAYLWCWIAALPNTCENGTNQGGKGPCERGHYAWVFRWAIYYGPVWFCVLTITLNMTVVSYLVWAKEKASLRFRFGHRSNLTSTSNASDMEPSVAFGEANANERAKARAGKLAQYFAKKRAKKQKQKERQGLASQVFWQAFYYVLGFYITWIAPTVLRMLQTIGRPVPYWILLSMSILLPLQGFFNFLVYVRPRVVQYHNRHPEKSIWAAVSRAIRRTVTVLYVSESRAFNETELQDIEALDPCYALQVEKEHELEEQEKRKSAESKMNIYKKGVIEEAENEMDNELPFDTTVEKAPLARDSMEQRRLDELKLLEQDDPSFYEGQSLNFVEDMDASGASKKMRKDNSNRSRSSRTPSDRFKDESTHKNEDSSNRDADDGPPTEIWRRPAAEGAPRQVSKAVISEEPAEEDNGEEGEEEEIERESVEVVAVERAPDADPQQQQTSSNGAKLVTDGKELMQILKSASKEEEEEEDEADDGEVSDYPALRSTQLYFYPEFSYDPDFYFI